MKSRILIVDKVHPCLIESLEKNGIGCKVHQSLDYDEFLSFKDTYDGLIIRSRFPVNKELIDSKKRLKFIVRIGSGMENIDVSYAESKGIQCFSTPEGNASSVAEHCLGMLFCVLRKINSANVEVSRGIWEREKNKGYEIGSRTVGIIGFGHTGKAFANLLKPFGCKIYVYDQFHAGFTEEHIEETSLPHLLQESDIVSLHINYSEENHHFFNYKLIQMATKPFIFINTSRGSSVKTDDLIKGLEKKKIESACLDVLEYESVQLKIPPKSEWDPVLEKLAGMENVILTPHIAGQTFDAEKRHAQLAVEKILSGYQTYGIFS